jgi:hypothetical protein
LVKNLCREREPLFFALKKHEFLTKQAHPPPEVCLAHRMVEFTRSTPKRNTSALFLWHTIIKKQDVVNIPDTSHKRGKR